MSINPDDYQYLVTFGPEANCTLALCPAEWSLQGYRPSIGANIAFIVLFFIGMVGHLFQGFRYRTWFFTISVVLGCIGEMVGYGGRIMLWQNPFSFDGFIIEIVCITLSPVFFAAAIYVSLTRITNFLDPKLCRFPPKLYYWVFIPTDIVSLILQAVGGAVSSSSTGKDEYAVDLTIAGLSFQVFTLFVFICMAGEYIFRYSRHRRALPLSERRVITTRLKIFAGFFSAAIIFILIRCCYRIAELAQGYTGSIFREQSLFIGLESVMIVAAVFSLNIGHPGFAFQNRKDQVSTRDLQERKELGFTSDSSSPDGADRI